jgi:thioesterase domain-containing protein
MNEGQSAMSDAAADIARYEQLAEAAYAEMYDARPRAPKDHYDDARLFLSRAIEVARDANLADEVARLTLRRTEITDVYDHQFRGVG